MVHVFFQACLGAGILAVYAYAAVKDFKTSEIPDRCPLFLTFAALAQAGLAGALDPGARLAGMLVLSLPMLALALTVRDSIGGGDIKLCAASGFLLGAGPLLWGAALAFLAAGAFGALGLAAGKLRRGDAFPLGPFLSLGFSWAFLWSGPASAGIPSRLLQWVNLLWN